MTAIYGKIANCTNDESNVSGKFLILFITGFFLIFIGIIILIMAVVLSGGSVNFGFFIWLGPFPIVVGAGPEATWMVLFAIILAVLSIIMFLILRREMEKAYV
ncbi:MAG: TIGR00304 family membrane protein [Candidatus Bathyarchaeales archaeon]